MSKRSGDFVTMDDLIKEVGKDATRFFFLMYAPETHMNFDLDLAKEHSMKNPVYYCQYAYVRANSILLKAKSLKLKAPANMGSILKLLSSDSELNLIKKLTQWPDILRQTADDYQVNRITRYALEVANAFHNFYEKERVVGAKPEVMAARLALVEATKIVLKITLGILGIAAPSQM